MDEKATAVQAMFGRLAARYDLANDLISMGQHRWWKSRAVRLAAVPVGGLALDLCTGTGDLAFIQARRVGPQGLVLGLDFCAPMLEVAAVRERGTSRRVAQVEFVQGRAEEIPLPDQVFEGCTVSFGLRNVSDLDASLREIHRVLKPGGRLVSLDVSTPDSRFFGPIYAIYFHRVLPVLGAAVSRSRSDYDYLPDSARKFPQKKDMCDRMLGAGFKAAAYYPLSGGAVALHAAIRG